MIGATLHPVFQGKRSVLWQWKQRDRLQIKNCPGISTGTALLEKEPQSYLIDSGRRCAAHFQWVTVGRYRM